MKNSENQRATNLGDVYLGVLLACCLYVAFKWVGDRLDRIERAARPAKPIGLLDDDSDSFQKRMREARRQIVHEWAEDLRAEGLVITEGEKDAPE